MARPRMFLVAGGVLVLAIFAAYENSLSAPFVFDDLPTVVDNASIRQLWPLGRVLATPANGSSATGRPLLNLSLAVDHAIGGLAVPGYHLTNLLLHALAALVLWGVLRRTLQWPVMRRIGGVGENAGWMSFACALLWAVHPLLTESVISVAQRSEVLGSLFYLLTLYCFIRAATAEAGGSSWGILAVIACLLGVASKEIIATAPLLVLLYDRTFVAGGFREAWRQRKWLHSSLAATWVPLGWLMSHSVTRGGSVGFGLGLSPWRYLLIQCEALTTYLQLSFWPHPLIIDYGVNMTPGPGDVWWRGLVVLALLAGTVVALWRKPVLGFLGAWFFVILAPSSSLVPLVTQPIAEHRMYLALAAVIVLVAGGIAARWGRRGVIALLAPAIVAAGLTWRRARDYRSETALWQDAVAHRPNARAVASLAMAYQHQGNLPEAVKLYEQSIRLDPDLARTHYDLGLTLEAMHRPAEAAASFERALQLKAGYAEAHLELGRVLENLGRLGEAEPQLRAAVAALPDSAEAHHSLAVLLTRQGRTAEALAELERVRAIDPGEAEVKYNYALLLAAAGRTDEAIRQYRDVMRLDPRHAPARMNLGVLLARMGRLQEGIELLRDAIRLDPNLAEARANLGVALTRAGRLEEAVASYDESLRLQPDNALAHLGLGNALAQLRRWDEARRQYAEALRLQPDLTPARAMLERLQSAPSGP
ncbi:MAG TPA: tetratricopeptide repeat protein [Opitutus sp.]|nr:tetratricopeptide repeat protein [Opitutus sp.]